MSNKEFVKKISTADDKCLLKLHERYTKKVKESKKSFKVSHNQNYENSYIDVQLNKLYYLFTIENLNCISKEIEKRGILV